MVKVLESETFQGHIEHLKAGFSWSKTFDNHDVPMMINNF